MAPSETVPDCGRHSQACWITEPAVADVRNVLRGVQCKTCPALFDTPCDSSACLLFLRIIGNKHVSQESSPHLKLPLTRHVSCGILHLGKSTFGVRQLAAAFLF